MSERLGFVVAEDDVVEKKVIVLAPYCLPYTTEQIACPFCAPNTTGQHEPDCPFSRFRSHASVSNVLASSYLRGWACPKCGYVQDDM